jgi:hypothetical protein
MTEFKRLQISTPAVSLEKNHRETMSELAFALASGIIDTMPFIGSKLNAEQERAWPRTGIFTDDGVEMTGIPPEIYELCELLASHIEKGAEFDVFQVFHKIARIDRLIDLSKGTITPPEEGCRQHVD